MSAGLPVEVALTYDGLPRITICQGTSFEVHQGIHPDYEFIDNLLGNMPSHLIICGHFHIQAQSVRINVSVINHGAVGVSLDSNSLTQFVALTGKDGHWEARFFSVGLM